MSAVPIYVDRLRALREARATSPTLAPVEAQQPSPQPPGGPLYLPPQALQITRPATPTRLAVALIGLPNHLERLVQAAVRGELPRGPVMLASGLVLDLSGYVLAWASSWPADREHTLSRLEEAHDAWTGQATGEIRQFGASRGELPQLKATSQSAMSPGAIERAGGTAELPQSKAALGEIPQVPGGAR